MYRPSLFTVPLLLVTCAGVGIEISRLGWGACFNLLHCCNQSHKWWLINRKESRCSRTQLTRTRTRSYRRSSMVASTLHSKTRSVLELCECVSVCYCVEYPIFFMYDWSARADVDITTHTWTGRCHVTDARHWQGWQTHAIDAHCPWSGPKLWKYGWFWICVFGVVCCDLCMRMVS